MGFVREAWHVLEPAQPFVDGWHLDVIAAHLEAITAGRITRLCINVPPGTMKSLMVSVFWPAWEWGPGGRPHTRYMATTYREDYTKRDCRRMRDLVASEWYQARWGDVVRLNRVGELSFANTATGNREGVPFGSLTGGRGDRVIIDDPHSLDKAESDADRERTIRTFRESVPLRVNDAQKSAIIVVMQRLHQMDVSGVIDKLGLGYERLILPMEFEADRRCETSLGVADRRTAEGELLWPERFPSAVVERDKIPLGSYAVAGQFQQRPAPREGGLFKRDWFTVVRAPPAGCRWVRGWDLAGTNDAKAAWTAGVKLGRLNGTFIVADVRRIRRSPGDVERAILSTASQDGQEVLISLPQDPGQAGKAQVRHLTGLLAGYKVRSSPETGSKIVRAEPVSAQAEAGNIKLVRGDWIEPFLDEVCMFPASEYADQTDALSRAFSELVHMSRGPRIT
jgi:predicted phage terminase large subunit-like protein